RDVQFASTEMPTPKAPRGVVRAPVTPFAQRGISAEVFQPSQQSGLTEDETLKRITSLEKSYADSDKYDGHLPYESLSNKLVTFRRRWDRTRVDASYLAENITSADIPRCAKGVTGARTTPRGAFGVGISVEANCTSLCTNGDPGVAALPQKRGPPVVTSPYCAVDGPAVTAGDARW
ncbi:hypothetical protein SEPCBS119000_006788, partial [Sporothrix epigloea]